MTATTRKPRPVRVQGKPIPLPGWWILAFQKQAQGFSDEQIANMANAAEPNRIVDWDRSTIGRFRRGKSTTLELTLAMCKVFDKLVAPVFVAGSREEALELLHVQQKHERVRREALARELAERANDAPAEVEQPKTGMQLIGERVAGAFSAIELADMEGAAQKNARKRAENALRAKKRRDAAKEK